MHYVNILNIVVDGAKRPQVDKYIPLHRHDLFGPRLQIRLALSWTRGRGYSKILALSGITMSMLLWTVSSIAVVALSASTCVLIA